MKLYEKKVIDKNNKKIKIFGIRFYKKYKINNITKRKILGGIFSTKETNCAKKYYFLGIRIYKKEDLYTKLEVKISSSLNTTIRELKERTQAAVTVAIQHQKVFPQFKNKHLGETAVLVATGPTLNYYKPNKNIIHAGVNTAFKKIELDYWFCTDFLPIKNYVDELINKQFVKFFGQSYHPFPDIYNYYKERHNPDRVINQAINSYKFYVEHANYTNLNIDIETQMLPDLGSSIFCGAIFLLFAGFKKIYIVGCDASATGHFNGDAQEINWCLKNLPRFWRIFKNYVDAFYPDVEIISVNPVGLKGLFKDTYTIEYLNANPEISQSLGGNFEILSEVL